MQAVNTSPRLAQLEGFLRQDPGNPVLLADAVMAAVECGATDRAEQWLADSLAGSSPALQHARGVLRLAQHRFTDAARVFEDLLAAGVANPTVRFNLAYARFRAGEYEAACGQFQRLLAEPDAPAETLAWLIRCLHHAGQPQLAMDAWRDAPQRLKTSQAAAVASLACLDDNQVDEALRLSEFALQTQPAPLEALVVRATLAVGEGNTALATSLLEEARSRAPSDGRVWSAWAAAQMALSDLAAAQEGFERAAQFLPEHVGSWVALSWCQILRGDLAGARASLDTALALDRNFAETHGGLAVVAAMRGEEAEARQAIERAWRLDPASVSAQYARAILAGQARDPEAVQALARRLLRDRSGGGAGLLEKRLARMQ